MILTRVSPGTTGRLNLHPSMPPKKKFFLAAWSSGSIITMPPSCAIASTWSTPAQQILRYMHRSRTLKNYGHPDLHFMMA